MSDERVAAPFSDEDFKVKVEKLIEKWQPKLGLQNFHFVVEVTDLGGTAMQCERKEGYTKVLFSVNKTAPHEMEYIDPEIERNVVHELVHMFFPPVRDLISSEFEADGHFWPRYAKAEELVVDMLTSVILRLAR